MVRKVFLPGNPSLQGKEWNNCQNRNLPLKSSSFFKEAGFVKELLTTIGQLSFQEFFFRDLGGLYASSSTVQCIKKYLTGHIFFGVDTPSLLGPKAEWANKSHTLTTAERLHRKCLTHPQRIPVTTFFWWGLKSSAQICDDTRSPNQRRNWVRTKCVKFKMQLLFYHLKSMTVCFFYASYWKTRCFQTERCNNHHRMNFGPVEMVFSPRSFDIHHINQARYDT